jgi:lipoprotein-anchoring transpeptidase ErfK/SrfK
LYAPMPYWMRLTWRGIGMHAGPIPRPGNPASHGCIRLPRPFAIQLYQIVRIGTPVRIIR